MPEVRNDGHSPMSTPSTSPTTPPSAERKKRGDLAWLALCAAVILASLLLHVTRDGRVSLDAAGAHPLPVTCPSRALTELNCPSCGLARSFVSLGHADIRAAWRWNRVGPLLYAFVLLQIPYRGLRLAWPAFRRRTSRRDATMTVAILFALIGLLIVNWGLYLAGLFHGH